MNKSKTNNRIAYIDVLNVVSALAVVFLHVNSCFWAYKGEESLKWWRSANIIESIFYFAVPVFFMITGATLLDYPQKYSNKEYFKKRIRKTVIPYIVWSLIGLIISVFLLKKVPLNEINVKYIIKGLIENRFVGIYWFFTALFCVYLSVPLLASVKETKKISIYSYILVFSMVINIFIPFLISVLNFNVDVSQYQISVSFGYLFYVLCGYVLNNIKIKKIYRVVVYVLAIIGLLMHIIGTYYLSIRTDQIVRTFKGYNNFPCTLYAIGVFLFIKNITIKFNEKILSFFTALSRYTFGVYLIHIFLVDGVELYFPFDKTSLIYRMILPFVIFFTSVGICALIKKIPIIQHLIP